MSVTAAKGFRAAGLAVGLKPSGRPDLALVVNDGPLTAAAGVFTSNQVQAAPVLWSRQVVAGGEVRAVLLNSGGANACTGAPGFQDTHACAEAVQAALDVSASEVAVCSTGLIGVRLDTDRLLPGIDKAAASLSAAGGADAAAAICTTDTVTKQASAHRDGWTVGGMAKGAGMLAPALATMLVTLTTDAVADAATLDAALREATRTTFDRLDTDGCMSTNDTVLLLASGASGVTPGPSELLAAVHEVCADLARQLMADAEGASKQISIVVSGAADEADAVAFGRAVARSALVKCAIHGEDPNWGRIVSALGTCAARFDPDAVDVRVNGVPVCTGGVSAGRDDEARAAMAATDIELAVDLKGGDSRATVLTTDLTAAYVHENSAYST